MAQSLCLNNTRLIFGIRIKSNNIVLQFHTNNETRREILRYVLFFVGVKLSELENGEILSELYLCVSIAQL